VNTVITHRGVTAGTPGTDDPFHDPIVIGIGVAFIVVALLILVMTGLFTWGNLYGAPSWNSHAFPPAIAH
jgi:hypothetical protein